MLNKNILLATVLAATCVTAYSAGTPVLEPPSKLMKAQVVAGQPFSATETVTRRQVLGDGNELQTETVSKVYRDSAGRMRRERISGGVGFPPIEITNEHGEMFLLDPATKSAIRPSVSTALVVHRKTGDEVTSGGQGVTAERLAQHKAEQEAALRQQSGRAMLELGTRDIAGLQARGRRYSHEIAAGAAGNRDAIEVVSETWTSTELKVYLQHRRSDPRSGESVTVLSGIERAEPDSALFAIPDDYKLSASIMGVRGE